MLTHNLGYPRIGSRRELKTASERYWSGRSTRDELLATAKALRRHAWQLQRDAGLDQIPSNDFSYYDHVLDMALTVGAVPERYAPLLPGGEQPASDLYVAMCRGHQRDGLDITAMEMTKWFDTNYHYIVPEVHRDQTFSLFSRKVVDEYREARELGFQTRPVLIGPVSFLLLAKEKGEAFDRLDLLGALLPTYIEIVRELQTAGAEWVQFDEPFLTLDIDDRAQAAVVQAYTAINDACPGLRTLLATYFEGLKGDNLALAVSLPISCLHIDLVRAPEQLDGVIDALPRTLSLSLGVVDGRNVWVNDLQGSLAVIRKGVEYLGEERVLIAPSCSLLHVPCDLDPEIGGPLNPELLRWMAFARQKVHEVATLRKLADPHPSAESSAALLLNREIVAERGTSPLINDPNVGRRVSGDTTSTRRNDPYPVRSVRQREALGLPRFPTTTIGSFPQTAEVRKWRALFRKGELTEEQYTALLREETRRAIQMQEALDIDVLVHGEFERNDMVEYFGERLKGFAFTANGWVQSYGSRCVKPPIIYGDVSRPAPMTVEWATFAQSITNRPVKGMLTGPVTILQWSFVRDDQPRSITCRQIALAMRDEVLDLERAGIRVIQIDEPALREGLPLRREVHAAYLEWAVEAFRIAGSGVRNETQIHTHMCYSEFNDIIEEIAAMDADVITIECSRSQMELLDSFAAFEYPNEIGPGVYDIHSPRVPAQTEMENLLRKAGAVIPAERLWVNPDCGLKTRGWEETHRALETMVAAAKALRADGELPPFLPGTASSITEQITS